MGQMYFFGRLWYAIWNFILLFTMSFFILIVFNLVVDPSIQPSNMWNNASINNYIFYGFILISLVIAVVLAIKKYKPLPTPKSIILFRAIIIIYVLLSISSSVIDFISPFLGFMSHQAVVYEHWALVTENSLIRTSSIYRVSVQIFSLIWIINTIALYGIFHMSRMSRLIFLISFVLYLLLGYIGGPADLSTNIGSLLNALSLIALGMIIMMMFTDPVKKYFSKKSEV